jgi:hypothetical protein
MRRNRESPQATLRYKKDNVRTVKLGIFYTTKNLYEKFLDALYVYGWTVIDETIIDGRKDEIRLTCEREVINEW